MKLKHFRISEFDSPDVPGSGNKMQPEFLRMLDRSREIAGVPFKITSGYRTKEHNKLVGGVSRSSHLTGWAADISCIDNRTRYHILSALIQVGFCRIGLAQTFVHVDDDPTKPADVWWLY